MKIHHIFYGLGIIFVLAAISYSAWECLSVLPEEVKAIIFFILSLVFIFLGKIFQERGI